MYRLVYRSVALIPPTDRQILAILKTALLRNAHLELTGFLLSGPTHFFQCIEGSKPNVDAVFSSIRADTRHCGLEILMSDMCEHRMFPDWAMGLDGSLREPTTDLMIAHASGGALSILDTLQRIADVKRNALEIRNYRVSEGGACFSRNG